ncbi:2-dehydro-3-deoxygalactonokinase [Aliikangiella coralliicola]|uniref:2-dehydro-3-deoxygalactonokinase n=1 Tax=Aliikangiella coralliicola TaxID=2592383 RepID=A0A545UIG3_9GAMM|nr:2-dehydro-3-deoxygalactonokinase [Aliikangiella coralliicola]TQV89223.1 2-dehydro-3-deoxygalactonokinase [Aliikangiella coralliicola]
MSRLIAVDWGSSSFRAYLVESTGKLLDTIKSDQGIFNLTRDDIETCFKSQCASWLDKFPQAGVLMSGMVGSRNGLKETQYLPTPCSAKTISLALESVELFDRSVKIVPGLCFIEDEKTSDVMRGEEVQILGAVNKLSNDCELICLPGTHSKWAVVEDGKIRRFSTFASGEMYSTLLSLDLFKGIIFSKSFDKESFQKGLDASFQTAGFLNSIFSGRVKLLSGELDDIHLSSYLSGVIIGYEILSATKIYSSNSKVVIVGSHYLQELYTLAFSHFNIESFCLEPDTTYVSGIYSLAKQNNYF